MIAPDQTTFDYLRRPPDYAPTGADWDAAVRAVVRTLPSQTTTPTFDAEVVRVGRGRPRAVRDLGHQPRPGASRSPAAVPDPEHDRGPAAARPGPLQSGPSNTWACTPGTRLEVTSRCQTPSSSAPAPTAGSRICARSADIIKGRQVADGRARCMVVPGLGPSAVAGRIRRPGPGVRSTSGAEWRLAGCSMCLGMNPDQLTRRRTRCASTSNRNFEGRQGKGGRTHLVSPLVAAATADTRHVVQPSRPDRRRLGASLV